jgi:hypothetical protein
VESSPWDTSDLREVTSGLQELFARPHI